MEVNNDNVKTIIDMVQAGIDAMSQKLGVALPHIWEVLVRQQYVSGIQSLAFIVLATIGIIVSVWGIKKSVRLGVWDFDIAVYMLCSTVILLSVIAIIVNINDAVGHLLNPEYYAMQEVVNMIKSK